MNCDLRAPNNYSAFGPLSTYVSANVPSVNISHGPINEYLEGFVSIDGGIVPLTIQIDFVGSYITGGTNTQTYYYNNSVQSYFIFPFSGLYENISITFTAIVGNDIQAGTVIQTLVSGSQENSQGLPGLSAEAVTDVTNTNTFAYSSTGSQKKMTNILAKKRRCIMSITMPMTSNSSADSALVSATNLNNQYTISNTGTVLLWPGLRQATCNTDKIIFSGSVACSSAHTFSVEHGNSVFKYTSGTGYSFGRTRTKGEVKLLLGGTFPTTVSGDYTISVFGCSINFTVPATFNSSNVYVATAGICNQIAPLFKEFGILVTYASSSLYFRELNSEVFINPVAANSYTTNSSVTGTFTILVAATTSATTYTNFLGTLYGGPGYSNTGCQEFSFILTKNTASVFVSVPNRDNMICAGTMIGSGNNIIDTVPSFYTKNTSGGNIVMTVDTISVGLPEISENELFTISHLGGSGGAGAVSTNCITSVARTNKGAVFEMTQLACGGTIYPASYAINAIRFANAVTGCMDINSEDDYAFYAEDYSVTDGVSDSYRSIVFGQLLFFRPPLYENIGIVAKPLIAGSPRPLMVFNILN